MSISPIVDANYRLLPTDLEGLARQVVIANVTYQGVEEMIPVLHFVGQTKRLVMSPEQVGQMIDLTGTVLMPKWIGVSIILQPRVSKGESLILLRAVTKNQRGRAMPIYIPDDHRGWYLSLTVVAILLAASGIYAALNITAILDALQQLRDNWPLR